MRSFGLPETFYLIEATRWTVYLSVLTFMLGGIVALALALARTSDRRVLRGLGSAYIQIFQNTPLLMQLFLIYFGLSVIGIQVPAVIAAAVGLTFYSSAFLGEIWRGCIQAVPRAQLEAADALALTRWQRQRLVVLPQALRIAIPPTVGFLVQIVKETSLTSIVGMAELMRAADAMNNATFQPIPIFTVSAIIYFVLCYPLSVASRRLERRLRKTR
jgi:polar amino acid transport system permease protein